MMKAIRIHSHGGPEVMRLEDIELPPPGPGEARVRHTAIGLNFSDINVRRGGFYQKDPLPMPIILGNEASGVVSAVGDKVDSVKVGDRVGYCGVGSNFFVNTGAYAQGRNVPAARLVKLPDGITDIVAAALMLKGLTAASIVNQVFRPKTGDTILIHTAAGGVGLLLVQWSKHLGATVIGTVGNIAKQQVALDHGCDHAILYRRGGFRRRHQAHRARWRQRRVRRSRQGYVCQILRLHGAIRHVGELRQRIRPCAADRHSAALAQGLSVRLPGWGQPVSRRSGPVPGGCDPIVRSRRTRHPENQDDPYLRPRRRRNGSPAGRSGIRCRPRRPVALILYCIVRAGGRQRTRHLRDQRLCSASSTR